jgi:ankyrin repeat protein
MKTHKLLLALLCATIIQSAYSAWWIEDHNITYAFKIGNLGLLHYLVETGMNIADLNIDGGSSALCYTTKVGNLETIQWILANEVDINSRDICGCTALACAAERGNLEICKWLFANSATIDSRDNDGRTAIHRAVLGGHLEIVQWLIHIGADITIADRTGEAAVHYAAKGGHLDILELLIHTGADMYIPDRKGKIAIHYAAQGGHLEMLKWLINNGTESDSRDNDGLTAVHYAAQGGRLEVLKWFLDNTIAIDTPDNKGRTAIHHAAASSNYIDIYLSVTCDRSSQDAMYNAASTRHIEVMEWLIANGIDINSQDENGQTPFHYAVTTHNSKTNIVKWLLAHGAHSNSQDNKGRTPFYYAVTKGCPQIVKLLLCTGNTKHLNNDTMAAIAKKAKCNLDKYFSDNFTHVRVILKEYIRLEQKANENPTQDNLRLAIEKGFYLVVNDLLEKHIVHPHKEDILLAKAMWEKTKDPIYKEIGKLLVAYYIPLDFLMKQIGIMLTQAKLPTEIAEVIASLANSCPLIDVDKQ